MKPFPRWFRWPCYVMAALFAVCVALQYNDPDPIRWMAIYGAAMLISMLLPARREAVLPGIVVGLGAAVWAIYLAHSVWNDIAFADLTRKMSEKGGAVEVGREAGGLAIEAVWLLAASAFRWTRSAPH